MIDDPELVETVEEVADQALRLILESAGTFGESGSLTKWSEVLSNAAIGLSEDKERLDEIEKRAGEFASDFFGQYGANVEKLINRTVDRWEADELIERIENQVGADLQFIRVNGTLIGGLVGLLLHGIGLLIWH